MCGGSGSWSEPYRKAGYDVRLVTLPEYDVTRWRDYPDLVAAVESGKVHGILAAPPCTMFSLARQNAKTPRDFPGAMQVVAACMEIIWRCRAVGPLRWWALENPRGYLRQFLGLPAYQSKAWYFEKAQFEKPTDIWGYFEAPRKKYNRKPKMNFRTMRWQKPPLNPKYPHITDRAEIRSITPAGFAKAFFKANH